MGRSAGLAGRIMADGNIAPQGVPVRSSAALARRTVARYPWHRGRFPRRREEPDCEQSVAVLEREPRAAADGGGAGNPAIVTAAPNPEGPRGNACLVAIYTKQPTLLGRRFVLDGSPIEIGRDTGNHVVLEGDNVSPKHAQLAQHTGEWWSTDAGSKSGSSVNDEPITGDARLHNGDCIQIGPTILKFLSGRDVEALYHEEIYRMTILDGLTQAHVKRHFLDLLEKETLRARRRARDLCVLMLDVDRLQKPRTSTATRQGTAR